MPDSRTAFLNPESNFSNFAQNSYEFDRSEALG